MKLAALKVTGKVWPTVFARGKADEVAKKNCWDEPEAQRVLQTSVQMAHEKGISDAEAVG